MRKKLNLAVKVELQKLATESPESWLVPNISPIIIIERKYFCSALKRRLSNETIYLKEIIDSGRPQFRWNHTSFPEKLHVISVNLKRINQNY